MIVPNQFKSLLNDYLAQCTRPLSYADCDYIADHTGAHYSHGETRWCFWFDDCDMVIKIPRFDGGRDFDYCARELHNYKKGCEYRIERILLPIEFVGEFGACKVYLQPRFTSDHENLPSHNMKNLREKLGAIPNRSKALQKSINNLYDWTDREWYARVLQLYGKKFLKSFEKFSREVRLNDLHDGNIGWRNGKPIILDYAGYCGRNNVDFSI